MKRIAATIATAVLLSGGLFTAPAHAEDAAAPPSCDETAQEWQARAVAAETTLSKTVDLLLIEKENVAQGNRIIARLVKRENRHKAKIAELRELLAEARSN